MSDKKKKKPTTLFLVIKKEIRELKWVVPSYIAWNVAWWQATQITYTKLRIEALRIVAVYTAPKTFAFKK